MHGKTYNSHIFRKLVHEKKKFLIPMTVLFFCFYLLLPVMVIYFPDAMNRPLVSSFTYGWWLAFAQFVMVWGLGMIYFYKAKKFDRTVEHIKQQRLEK